MSGEPRIELRGVTFRFGDTAVAPLDLTIARGEFVALLGPAGSGKTTVLRAIAGLDRPAAGAVWIDGLDVTPMPAQRRDVALVFQDAADALYPHMTVARNLAFPMRAQRIARNAIERRVSEVIDRLKLDDVRNARPRRLSAEQARLAGLGRAMVRDAKAFLFDEPLAPFEGPRREHMRRELRAIHAELKATTVLATRDPVDAIATADRVVVMNAGRVVQAGTPQAVYDRPADLFVARFLGAHAMNFHDASFADGVARLNGSDVAFAIEPDGAQPVDASRVTLGLRPEHVRLDRFGLDATVTRAAHDHADLTLELQVGPLVTTARVPLGSGAAPGDHVRVRLDVTGCRWFDATSGQALPWRTMRVTDGA